MSVVVCTYTFERLELLRGLVASLAAGDALPGEVIVAVDSNDRLRRALLEQEWPLPITVVASPGTGLAAARNAGWRVAGAPFVAFIDDDAVATTEWLAELLMAADRHGADIVGGRIDPEWIDGRPSWFHPMLGWVVGCSYEGLPTIPAEVRNVIGCNMLIRRDLLERLGGFDANLGRMGRGLAGCEETEFCIRAGRTGARIVSIPDARVTQILPPARGTLGHAVRRGWDEGRSKRALVAMHGPVLQTESRYASALVAGSVRLAVRGIVQRRWTDIQQAVALTLVLAATGLSYISHRAAGATAAQGWRRADPAQGG